MSAETTTTLGKRWTAADLRKLPPAERDAILAAAAARAEAEYRNDAALTDFEAYGKDDLYGQSADAQTRRDLAD
jgi:acyl-CoA reductase-like NAD-dependent aldehyde dehydrogenase